MALRKTRTAPAAPVPAAPQPSAGPRTRRAPIKPSTPVKTIPITPSKAYVPPADEDSASKTDFVAVITRYKDKVDNRKSAIRAHCIECSSGQLSEVRDCAVTKCALYPFRMGADPHNKKTASRLAATEEDEG